MASRLFAEKGFGNTPTSEIAREAGVAEGTLYHHFGSKDGIFLTLFNDTVGGYLAGMENRIGQGKTGAETLRDLIRFHFEYLERHAEQFLIILRDLPDHIARERSGAGAERKKKFGRVTTLLTGILERGAADGTFHLRYPARDTAEILRGILYGTTRHKMLGIIEVPLPRLAEMLTDLFEHALSHVPGTDINTHGGAPE